jgi:hypothetical protein
MASCITMDKVVVYVNMNNYSSNMWQRINLTPMGNITVLKSIILPRITHMLASLPNPDSQCIKELECLFFKFIWNNKGDKIKRNILVKEYNVGGLRMINVQDYIASLKLSWPLDHRPKSQ